MMYLISDTHLNHVNMIEFCGRPSDFEKKILKNLKILNSGDTLLHLGDICMGRDDEMHRKLNESCFARRILIKGNHDRKSYQWYLDHGWSMVCETLTLNMYGRHITLSHKPVIAPEINIYGHFHNNPTERCEEELTKLLTPNHWQFCLEHTYEPVKLDTFIKKCLHLAQNSKKRVIYA